MTFQPKTLRYSCLSIPLSFRSFPDGSQHFTLAGRDDLHEGGSDQVRGRKGPPGRPLPAQNLFLPLQASTAPTGSLPQSSCCKVLVEGIDPLLCRGKVVKYATVAGDCGGGEMTAGCTTWCSNGFLPRELHKRPERVIVLVNPDGWCLLIPTLHKNSLFIHRDVLKCLFKSDYFLCRCHSEIHQ